VNAAGRVNIGSRNIQRRFLPRARARLTLECDEDCPRTGFDAAGERHLQGCYADLDGVASTAALLRRTRRASR
jgi:hypothetical protein